MISNKTIARTIHDRTGIPLRDVKDTVTALIHFIGEQLAAGKSVNLHTLGTIHLKFRHGRTTTFKGKKCVQPDCHYAAFRASNILKQKLKTNTKTNE